MRSSFKVQFPKFKVQTKFKSQDSSKFQILSIKLQIILINRFFEIFIVLIKSLILNLVWVLKFETWTLIFAWTLNFELWTFCIGVWFNGRTGVSKTLDGSPILSTPAKEVQIPNRNFLFVVLNNPKNLSPMRGLLGIFLKQVERSFASLRMTEEETSFWGAKRRRISRQCEDSFSSLSFWKISEHLPTGRQEALKFIQNLKKWARFRILFLSEKIPEWQGKSFNFQW